MALSLVTGASGGIGGAVVDKLLERGDTVIAADLDISSIGTRKNLYRVSLDVRDSAKVGDTISRIRRDFGGIDNLVNVAGIFHHGKVEDTTDSQWKNLFDVNVFGVFLLCREVAPLMAGRGTGSITTVASNAGSVPRGEMAAYAASKAAASSFTRSLGIELGRSGVRCNVVCPGTTRTSMIKSIGCEADFVDGDSSIFKAGIPLGRIAEPVDIAEVVAFMTSEGARHMTLQEVIVDGGASQR